MTTPCSLNCCPFPVISQVGREREAQEDSSQHIPHLLLVEQQCAGCSSTTGLFPATGSLGKWSQTCATGQQQETLQFSCFHWESLPSQKIRTKVSVHPSTHCSVEWKNTCNKTSVLNWPCSSNGPVCQSGCCFWQSPAWIKTHADSCLTSPLPSTNSSRQCLPCLPTPTAVLGERMSSRPPSSLSLFKLSVVNYSAAFQLDTSQGAKTCY